MSKETQFGGEQVGLGLVAINAGFSEGLEDGSAVLFMFLHGL